MVLGAVGAVGVIAVLAVAPNVIGAMAKLGLLPAKRQAAIINRARDRLVKKGLLKKNSEGFLELTPRGRSAYMRAQAEDSARTRPRRWDRRWRVLIFDIPEYRRVIREEVRRALQSVGFTRLQNSVWVYPYDCEDFVALLKADVKVGKRMLYLVVEEMEGDGELKKYFRVH
jgi:DNA-binding transcriptional regulator PaaX